MIEGLDEIRTLQGLTKNSSASRKDLIFRHIISDDQRGSIIQAYKVKLDISKKTPKKDDVLRIYSTSPLMITPENKFNHVRGARISPITPSKRQQQVN